MIRKKTDSGWWEGELQVRKYTLLFLQFVTLIWNEYVLIFIV